MSKVVHVEDKGKGTALTVLVETRNSAGTVKVYNEGTIFNRDARPKEPIKASRRAPSLPDNAQSLYSKPPQMVHKETLQASAATLYRLSGDLNPLHMYYPTASH